MISMPLLLIFFLLDLTINLVMHFESFQTKKEDFKLKDRYVWRRLYVMYLLYLLYTD